MEADATPAVAAAGRMRVSVLGLLPLALIALAAALFVALGAPGLGERRGPPAEELLVERTVLRPGEIELTVRNDGPDAVRIAQIAVNDAYVDFRGDDREVGRLASEKLVVRYPWIEGEAYEIFLLTSTGGTVEHAIDVAVETPSTGIGFYGLMALLGTYVGVVPVILGMLWLPFVRRISAGFLRLLMALTIGLLVFLAIDATLEGVEVAGEGAQAFGGAALVFLGAIVAYLAFAAIDAHMRAREQRARAAGAGATYVALLVAIGIGLHNLGEGVAIGAAYATGALALGALLVVGFALHNTTEGLAIVAPVAARRPSLARLAVLGLVAGAPAILGAWIGATAFNASVAGFLLGVGAGAIVQVVQLLVPFVRDDAGRFLHAASVAGVLAGVSVMYVTGLLVAA
ncbi:MAG: ZIP family metal transporter [Actinomycetota bacterium]|nr:ZIP family metal transporter [Actinomycetota bacterium]